jgi:DNA repair protein RecO (recombination protein O)
MLHKTRGIVLHRIDYSETSIIVKIFTEHFGLQSYIVKGIRKPKTKIKGVLFSPLSLVNIEVYHKEKSSLQHIREISADYQCTRISSDFKKSAISLFINELLYRSLHADFPDPNLFQFIRDTIIQLDKADGGFTDYHLAFAIHLTRFLGFFPQAAQDAKETIFDMQEAVFTSHIPNHPLYIESPLSLYFDRLLKSGFPALKNSSLPHNVRQELIDKIVDYYRLHLPVFGEMQSHKILAELLKD